MLGKYCESACFDGIRELYESRTNKPKFIFWAAVMIMMFNCSVWFTYKTIVGYLDTDTVTSISTIRSSTMQLPELLICYNGGLNVSSMKEANLSENLIKLFHKYFYVIPDTDLVNNSDAISAVQELQAYGKRNRMGVKDIVEQFSYNCHVIVTQFIISKKLKTCENARTIITPKGKCFAFVDNGIQYYPSLYGGMVLTLQSPQYSFYNVYPLEARNYNLRNDFSITIEKKLGREQSYRWIIVAPFMSTEVTLWAKLYKRSSQRATCENYSSYYSSNDCFNMCYLKAYVKAFHCMPKDIWSTVLAKNILACNPFEKYILNRTEVEESLDCQKKCKPMCLEWIFESSISTSFDGSPNFPEAYVKIAYNTMQYILIEEVDAFTLDMAIANVGGQSGLWLGCSIITIIQAVYHILIICFNYCSKNSFFKRKAAQNTPKIVDPRDDIHHLY